MIGDKIRSARIRAGYTQEQLAKAIGTTKQNIYKYEMGIITNIPLDRIEAIAAFLNVPPSFLTGWSEEPASTGAISNIISFPKTRHVPIVGPIACGLPILAEENIEGYADMPENIKADFALRCVGDSMVGARICDGDIVYIRQSSEFHNGDICAVLVDGDEATLKRVYRISNTLLELRAENPSYPIQRFEGERLGSVRIIGKAVAFTSTIRH